MREGTVVSVDNKNITWKSSGKLITDDISELEIIMQTKRVKIITDWELYRYYKSIDRRRRENGSAGKLKHNLKKTTKQKRKSRIEILVNGIKQQNRGTI